VYSVFSLDITVIAIDIAKDISIILSIEYSEILERREVIKYERCTIYL